MGNRFRNFVSGGSYKNKFLSGGFYLVEKARYLLGILLKYWVSLTDPV